MLGICYACEALCCSAYGCCAVKCGVACCTAQHTAIATLTVAIFRAMLDSLSVVPKDKVQVAYAGDYLAKWLAMVAALVDNSVLAMAADCNAIPHS